MLLKPEKRLAAYMALVVAVALPLTVVAWTSTLASLQLDVSNGQALLVLAVMAALIIGELFPIPIARGEEAGDEITVSSMFGLVLLLIAPLPAAFLAQAVALTVDEGLRRHQWSRLPFNLGQYALSILAARGAYALVSGDPFTVTPYGAAHVQLGAGLVAALVMLLCNNALVTVAIALHLQSKITRIWNQDLRFNLAVAAPLLALAPVIAQSVHQTPWSLGVLLLPIVALHHSGHQVMRREQQALRDPLTQLGNRTLLFAVGHRTLTTSSLSTAVLILDLDHFKEINDTLGHGVGDEVLLAVAERLVANVEPDDVVTRLGGDEFAILVRKIHSGQEAVDRAVRITTALQEPILAGKVLLDVQASIGVAVSPEHADTFPELMRLADIALYRAKADRNTHAVFSRSGEDVHSLTTLNLHGDLRRALSQPDDAQLWVAFQPQLDLATGRLSSVEALTRWTHPALGPLSPKVFIPIAENTGLISQLTERVLRESLRQMAAWRRKGLDITLAVNLSARDVTDRALPALVSSILAEHQVDPSRLVLEITESRLMSDPDRAATVLRDLALVGVQLSIDDYGTGYSSLAYLQRLEVHELKIDRSFITDVRESPTNATIVRSTIDLAHGLGLRVVAEGVEDDLTLQLLIDWGCDVAQGYQAGRPAPAPELHQLGQHVRPGRNYPQLRSAFPPRAAGGAG